MESSQNHDILILYASQTGTAEYVSEEIGRELAKRDFIVEVKAMDNYEVMNLPNEKFVIFIASTTGQGEAPDNMKNFWKFLLIKELPSDSLSAVKFSVFGLGDSGYAMFNATARRLYQRLLQLGAKEFHERGLGDDQHEFGYDTEFVPWLEKLIEKLKTYFPNKKYIIQESKEVPAPKFLVENVEKIEEEKYNDQGPEESSLRNMKRNFCFNKEAIGSKLVVNDVLTANDAVKEVRYVELEVPEEVKLKYDPGDVAVIMPRNDPETCKKLAERLGYDYHQSVKIKRNKGGESPFPEEPILVKDLLEYWLNVMGPPTRYFFRVLSYFTENELHKNKLREFGDNSSDGKIEYNNYCFREKRNIYEVLFDFETVNLPLNYLLEAVSLQKPREYSISTSLLQHPRRIGLTIAMTRYSTPLKRQITGVCSQWFSIATIGEIVPLWVRKGTLPYPRDVATPVICVGPGTGVAPHLSFLEERARNLLEPTNGTKTYLLFGNRNSDKDFIHREKMENWQKENKLNLLTAFSRDQEQKIYVYHKIREYKKELCSLILENKNTVRIFVCGSSKNMPKWVEETFVEILAEEIGVDEAKKLIQKMNNEKRYVVEAW